MTGISNHKNLRVKFSNGQEIEAAGYSDECLIAMVNHLRTLNTETETSSVHEKLDQLIAIGENIMATLADFQTKIDTINANTTASAEAAAAVATRLAELKTQLDTVLTDAGLPAAEEAAILSNIDGMVSTTDALKKFLQATAAKPNVEPVPVPVPEPVA